MTTKRFEVYDDGFSKHIEDTYYTEDKHEHNLYDIWEMCRKLNELHSRNKRLEEKIQRERISFTKTHERWSKETETKIKELSEENKQLKSDLARIIEQAKKNDEFCRSDIKILENALWCPNCANDIKRLKELRKEFLG